MKNVLFFLKNEEWALIGKFKSEKDARNYAKAQGVPEGYYDIASEQDALIFLQQQERKRNQPHFVKTPNYKGLVYRDENWRL